MDLALLILGMAAVTFASRFIMIALLGRWTAPPWVMRALYFVPIAAFAALIAPDLVTQSGQVVLAVDNPRLIGGIAAILVAAVTRRMVLTIVAGMGALWIAQALLAR